MERKAKKRIKFTLEAPEAGAVFIAGDFNDWDTGSHPLKPDGKNGKRGTWKGIVHLDPGIHEYRFIVDGAWHDDPTCMEGVPNEFGTCNCVVRV
jgi:1,4-alpha-glucan branching enzyme